MKLENKKFLRKLKFRRIRDLELYVAGLPNFPRNFSRDSIISSILMQDSNSLKNQLIFCAKTQGEEKNPHTAEEKGKIIHEFPGAELRNLSTKYNASDTTALFLIGHEIYQKLTGDSNLKSSQKRNIVEAVHYIERHLDKRGAFIEDPKYCGAKKFALKVTYWKDSELVNREKGEPRYPLTINLLHLQNMRAMKSASFLLKDKKYLNHYNKMLDFFNKNLYDDKKNLFYLGMDKSGKIENNSTDMLHSLFYLDKKDLSKKQLDAILKNSLELETKKGYRAMVPNEKINDKYHVETVWPFEQAIIHAGTKKFELERPQKITRRVLKYINKSPFEILLLNKKRYAFGGCKTQLWTIAAKEYFNKKYEKCVFP